MTGTIANRQHEASVHLEGSVVHLPATLMRGGTSKCWILFRDDVDATGEDAELLLIRGFGSPDPRQIDGVGGGTSTTSKAIIIESGRHASPDGVLEYSFAQVSVNTARVDWSSNCGNCATGLGLFAVQKGLVPIGDKTTRARLKNIITGLELTVEVDTPHAAPPNTGDAELSGVAYPGVPVDLMFHSPTWTSFGALFPTGNRLDQLTVGHDRVRATLIDAGAPAVLILAKDMGLTGDDDLVTFGAQAEWFNEARQAAAKLMKLPMGSQSVPKVGIVGLSTTGTDSSLSVRMMSMDAPHPMIGLTSAVAVAVATGSPGTVIDLLGCRPDTSPGAHTLTLELLGGRVTLDVDMSDPAFVRFRRSARRLADAVLCIPKETK